MRTFIALLLIAFSASGRTADSVVLYDAGNTIDVETISADLLDPIASAKRKADSPPDTRSEQTQSNNQNDSLKGEAQLVMPLRVPGLSVARVEKVAASFEKLKAPVCVIGADDKSLSWLVSYYDQLVRMKARCLLVQVDNQEQLARVAKYAGDIPVMPDVGGVSVQLFNIQHYPVLISQKWIEQ